MSTAPQSPGAAVLEALARAVAIGRSEGLIDAADRLLLGARFYARLAGHSIDAADRRSHRAIAVTLRDHARDLESQALQTVRAARG